MDSDLLLQSAIYLVHGLAVLAIVWVLCDFSQAIRQAVRRSRVEASLQAYTEREIKREARDKDMAAWSKAYQNAERSCTPAR